MGIALVGIAIPNFVLAPVLALLFGVKLGWLPVAGWEAGSVRHLVLPVVTLALPFIAYIARLTRGSLLEVLQAPYMRAARAKGLSRGALMRRHALKPTLLPVVSFLGPAAAALLTGSLVVEQVFGLPGVGPLFRAGRDQPRLHAGHGHGDLLRGADPAAQSRGRPALRLARPEDPP